MKSLRLTQCVRDYLARGPLKEQSAQVLDVFRLVMEPMNQRTGTQNCKGIYEKTVGFDSRQLSGVQTFEMGTRNDEG